jgi:fumarate reductase flavoprotein subunit
MTSQGDFMSFDHETDVVVVGAGACGSMAAYRAGLQGLDVVLLDKDARLGCNAQIASGSLPAAGTHHQQAAGIEDTPELMAADILRKNKGRADPAIVRTLCERSTEIVRIFEQDLGVPIELNRDASRAGFSVMRLHNGPGRTGVPLIRALHAALQGMANVTYADRTPGTGLIGDAGDGVAGVTAGPPDAPQRIGARRVILACDGFGSNAAMIARYIPEMVGVECIGVQGNTGDAIRWGMELGAAVDHMSAYQGHGLVCAGYGTRLSPEIPQLGAVIVNRRGHRFAREDQGYSEFAREVVAQPDRVAVAIFDQNMYDVVARLDHWKEAVASGAIKSAPTLEALFALFGLPANAVRASFEECAGTRPDPHGRALLPVPAVAPFYGSLITGAMAHTQGGLAVDVHARVLRPDGSPIANLYAGGGSAAGISGDDAQGYMSGNGLLSAYGLGMIAGDHAAHSISTTSA